MGSLNTEKMVSELCSLFSRYGYDQFNMSKFEEYDLYARNKNFLVSDNIITFTDTNGKLMALKPDVTLSIAKNSRVKPGQTEKVYYYENVYRVSEGSGSFAEIPQLGVECIGDVGSYDILEVMKLAADSLSLLSSDYVLGICHLGIVSSVIESTGIGQGYYGDIYTAVSEKNAHALDALEESSGVSLDAVRFLIRSYGDPKTVISSLRSLSLSGCGDVLCEIEEITSVLEESGHEGKIVLDFSEINDFKYYNGFVFRGYISGIMSGVLSGGQYDQLLLRLGKKDASSIGFAVYLDSLQRLAENDAGYDVDTLLVYEEGTPAGVVCRACAELLKKSESVRAVRTVPDKAVARKTVRIDKCGRII